MILKIRHAMAWAKIHSVTLAVFARERAGAKAPRCDDRGGAACPAKTRREGCLGRLGGGRGKDDDSDRSG